MEGGRKRHFENCIADPLFLLFSEKGMKSTASKSHADSAGKCSLDLLQAAFGSLWLVSEHLTFP